MESGWITENGTTYYLRESGKMHTGWLTVGSDQYYFAVYDYVRGDLEIETTGVTLSGRSSEYEVTGNDAHNSWIKIRVSIDGEGSRTITGLPIGNYTVTPTAWPWRYTQPSAQTVTVVETPKVTASFASLQVTEPSGFSSQWMEKGSSAAGLR